jgi:hypothetical protein
VAEIQGINYNFIEKKKFLSMIDNVALDGTEILFAISNVVPPPLADVLRPNTTFVAAEVMFAAKTDSTFKTNEASLTLSCFN